MRLIRKQSHIVLALIAICHNNFICCNASKSLLSSISSYFNTNQNDSSNNIKINYSSITSDDELLQLLYQDYHNIKGSSVLDRIRILLTKHGIKDHKKRANMRRLLLEKLGEDESSPDYEIIKSMNEETDAIRDAAKKHLPTREEIAKLPKWKERENVVGTKHGDVRHFQDHEGKLLIAKWDATSESWNSDIRKILRDNFQGVFGKSGGGHSSPVDTTLEQRTSGSTLEEITQLPKWDSHRIDGLNSIGRGEIKLFQKDGKAIVSKWNIDYHSWSKPEEITESHYKNGYEGLDTDDLIRKSIQYEHALTYQMDQSSTSLLIGYNNGDDPLISAQTVIDEYKLDKSSVVELADSIRQWITSPPLSYTISNAGSKHVNGRYNLNQKNGELWYHKQIPTTELDSEDGKKLTIMRCTMKDKTKSCVISKAQGERPCSEGDVYYYHNKSGRRLPQIYGWYQPKWCIGKYPMPKLAIGIPLDEQGGRREERNRPTPEEISKLPKWKNKFLQTPKSLVGLGKRQVKLFHMGGKIVKAAWRVRTQTWTEMTVITEFHYKNGLDGWDVLDLLRKSIQYEHALTYRSEEESLIIGYNYGDDPFVTARRVIDEYKLGSDRTFFTWKKTYPGRIADFIREAEEVINSGVPQPKISQSNQEAYWISLILVIAIGFIYLYEYGKGSPKKTSPIINKIILVKLSATNRLKRNQGRKLKGLINKSGVEDIQIGTKADQLSLMNKIEASSGVRYVPVHINGREEAVQKAVAMIQAIGKENVDEEIKLPPTRTQQASTIRSTVCVSCQSLRTTAINTYKKATNYIGKGTVIAVAVLYSVWLMILLLQYQDCSTDKYCQPTLKAAFVGLVLGFLICSAVVLVLRIIAYGISLVNKYTGMSKYGIIIVFGSLCCTILLVPCTINDDKCDKVEMAFLIVLCLLLSLFILDDMDILDDLVDYMLGLLRIKQTIYIRSSRSKELEAQQNKKLQEIVDKSDLDEALIELTAVVDDYVPIHMTGSRRSVQKAIDLIKEAVGTEHVSITKPSNTTPIRSASSTGNVPVSEAQSNQKESTSETPVQCESKSDNGNSLAKEASTTNISPAALQVKEEEEVPSEIGIDSSQGMTTRDTITEASVSSLNDRSNTSKAYSSFSLDEDDPLLIFLRSQESCIKGSVDEFFTWLVKSEDIDSMLALKEAVNEDDYLSDMKVGDEGGSGIKGFKRKAFLRAISEYFDDESDTKSTAEEHQSLPQCQKKDLSDTVEPPEELVCPISLVLMTNDPAVAADGITYERASIEDWFKKSKAKISKARENLKQNPQSEADQRVVDNGICSPVYGSKLENLSLVPHVGTRNMARAFEEKKEAGS